MSRLQFDTKFVWDHGGSDVLLCISRPDGMETVRLGREEDGTFEATISLGQGRYEYFYSVDGNMTHDPDLPALKNEQGHYSNLLKIVDAKNIVNNKKPNLDNLERETSANLGGISGFVEKCLSEATINETLGRERSLSLTDDISDSENIYESDESGNDDFPDLDDALDIENPIFITESPLPYEFEEVLNNAGVKPSRSNHNVLNKEPICRHTEKDQCPFEKSQCNDKTGIPQITLSTESTNMGVSTDRAGDEIPENNETPQIIESTNLGNIALSDNQTGDDKTYNTKIPQIIVSTESTDVYLLNDQPENNVTENSNIINYNRNSLESDILNTYTPENDNIEAIDTPAKCQIKLLPQQEKCSKAVDMDKQDLNMNTSNEEETITSLIVNREVLEISHDPRNRKEALSEEMKTSEDSIDPIIISSEQSLRTDSAFDIESSTQKTQSSTQNNENQNNISSQCDIVLEKVEDKSEYLDSWESNEENNENEDTLGKCETDDKLNNNEIVQEDSKLNETCVSENIISHRKHNSFGEEVDPSSSKQISENIVAHERVSHNDVLSDSGYDSDMIEQVTSLPEILVRNPVTSLNTVVENTVLEVHQELYDSKDNINTKLPRNEGSIDNKITNAELDVNVELNIKQEVDQSQNIADLIDLSDDNVKHSEQEPFNVSTHNENLKESISGTLNKENPEDKFKMLTKDVNNYYIPLLVIGEIEETNTNVIKEDVESGAPRDVLAEINNTLRSIEKSKSNSKLNLMNNLAKSLSTDVVKEEQKNIKVELPQKDDKIKTDVLPAASDTRKGEKGSSPHKSSSKLSPKSQRRQDDLEKRERMKMSKKLDDVFGLIRSEPVEEIKTEIKIRGMGDIQLGRKGPIKKMKVEKNKMDEYAEQKRAAQKQISMPEKPATYKKLKPKPKESIKNEACKEETIEGKKSGSVENYLQTEVETNTKTDIKPKPKKSNFFFITKPPTPPPSPPEPSTPSNQLLTFPIIEQETPTETEKPSQKELTPDLTTKFWPKRDLPSTVPPIHIDLSKDTENSCTPTQKVNNPLKIGINGFDRIGRLAFRAAIQSGLEVTAVNDPFIPLHYMVYSLKFDMAKSPWSQNKQKQLQVREGPLGQLVVNGKVVHVFTEIDPHRIPWDTAGVNYVIEATESLNSKVDARGHLEPSLAGVKMKEIVNRPSSANSSEASNQEEEKLAPPSPQNHRTSVKKVIIGNSSPDAPSFGIGINDASITSRMPVIGHVSAAANALILPLKIIQESFGVRFCSYTLVKAIMGVSREIKCPNMGPFSHARSVKWDFKENLVPAPCPVLQEETIKFLPNLRGRVHGMVLYTPVPEVSMFDLTISVEKESDELYRDICLQFKEVAEGHLKGVVKYVMKMSDENSASCVFTGCPQSVVFDARSGCQIDRSTVKIVLWFDNEHGFANRIVDLVKHVHKLDEEQHS